jgi:1,4-alpha-glucan branching enzyme
MKRSKNARSRVPAKPSLPAGKSLGVSEEARKKRVSFAFTAAPGSKVFVAGTFNNWDPNKDQLKEKAGVFSLSLHLPAGRHEYKFIVDGTWYIDSKCPDFVPNAQGTLNSVLTVG